MPVFGVKVTAAGLAAFADSAINGTPIVFAEVAIGDGNGAPIVPLGSEMALYHEIGRHPTTAVTIDPGNPNWIVVETIIPAEAGGFTIREVGIYAAGGTLIAIGSYPEQYKPTLAEQFGEDLHLTLILEVTNAANVTIVDGGSVIYATRTWLEQRLTQTVNWYTLNW